MGNALWAVNGMDPNASQARINFKCLSNEAGSGQYVDIFLREFPSYNWIQVGTITDKINQAWTVTIPSNQISRFISSSGECAFIVGSNDGYVFDYVEFQYYKETPFLSVSPSSRNVQNTSGNTTFSISSNINWTVSDDANWLTISPISGSNSATITATYQSNTSTTSTRTAKITVNGGGLTSNMYVYQAGADYINITPSSRNVSYSAGSTTFNISSNTSWTLTDDASWLTVSPTSGNNGTITASYQNNNSTNSRTANITVIGGIKTEKAYVYQDGSPYIVSMKWVNSSEQEISSVNDEENVYLKITTSGYTYGTQFNADIYEKDTPPVDPDDYVTVKTISVNNNSGQTSWKAMWQSDGLGGLPEVSF